MKCVFCGGKLEKRTVEEEVAEGSDRILVEVEAEVCLDCHEPDLFINLNGIYKTPY